MKRVLTTGIGGGFVGALIFWLYQVNFQGATIPAFIGAQIVLQGKYALSPGWVRWGVHLWVSLSYAFLFALIVRFLLPRRFTLNRTLAFALALALGWITTLIAAPAIQITITLLAGKGFPAKLWPLNPAKGRPFWNHLIFFAVVWAIDTGSAFLHGEAGGNEAGDRPEGAGE